MKLSFFGAVGEVTGSCYFLETGSARILIDCGMFQGSKFADDRNHAPLPFDASKIDAVLVTHAHLDHVGRIPKLAAAGFAGPIFATRPTMALAKIILDDALEVMKYHEKKQHEKPAYTEEDVKRAEGLFSGIDYDKKITVAPGVTATWHDAGHILGSAFIEIEINESLRAERSNPVNKGITRIVFSGDLGNHDVPIIRTLESLVPADVLVMESTYGAHNHEDTGTRVGKLRDAIMRTVKLRGVLVIPAFAVERIQEILYELDALVVSHAIPPIPMFLDSPLAIHATQVFEHFPNYYDEEAAARVQKDGDFFNFPGLRMTLTRDESRAINDAPQPKVIIAGAGMMTGGRVFHHLRRYLQDPHSTVLIVGYQSEKTLGRQLLDGAKEVTIFGDVVAVRATIEKIGGYSAHADRAHLAEWVAEAKQKPKKIFLVHGEDDARAALGGDLEKQLGIKPESPAYGASYEI